MLRKLSKALLALGAFLLLGLGLLVWNLNPLIEQLRPKIQTALSAKLGKSITFDHLSFRLLPTLGIELKELRLAEGSTEGKEGTHVKRALLRTKLFPLVLGDFLVEKLEVEGGELKLVRTEQGALELGGLPLTKPKAAGTQPDVAPQTGKKGNLSFAITDAVLKDTRIFFTDRSVHPVLETGIEQLEAELKEISSTGVDHFSFSGKILNSKTRATIAGGLRTIDGAPEGNVKVKVSDLSLTWLSASFTGLLPPELLLSDEVSFDMKLAVNNGQGRVDGHFEASSAEIGYGNVFHKAKDTPFSVDIGGTVALLGSAQLDTVRWKIGEVELETPVSTQLSGELSIGARSKRLSLEALAELCPPLKQFSPKGSIAADVRAAITPGAPPVLSGTAELEEIALAVPSKSEPPLPPLTITNVNAKLDFQPDAISLRPLSIVVAGQKFDAGARLTPQPNAKLQLAAKAESFELAPLLRSFMKEVAPTLQTSLLKQLQFSATYSHAERNGGITAAIESGVLSELPLGPTKLSADIVLNENNTLSAATLQPSKLQVFGGTLNIQGALQPSGSATVQLTGSGIDLAKAMPAMKGAGGVSMTGTLTSLDVRLAGPKDDFGGKGSGPIGVKAAKGTIEGFNLLAETLGKIDKIPGLGATLLSFVPEKHRPLLQLNSTPFDSLAVNAQLNARNITLSGFTLEHPLYTVNGKGTIKADGDMELDTQLSLSEELTGGMVLKESKLKLLLDRNRSMVFPVLIRKSGNIFIILPDVTNLAKRALQNTATDAAAKALDKVAPGLGGAIDSLFK